MFFFLPAKCPRPRRRARRAACRLGFLIRERSESDADAHVDDTYRNPIGNENPVRRTEGFKSTLRCRTVSRGRTEGLLGAGGKGGGDTDRTRTRTGKHETISIGRLAAARDRVAKPGARSYRPSLRLARRRRFVNDKPRRFG